MKNKIAFLSLHPGFGGAASANANILKMLSQENEIHFIDEYPDSTFKYIEDKQENIHKINFPIGTNKFFPWKLNKVLDQVNPDYIIVGCQFLLIFYGPILLRYRFKKCKIYSVFHSLTLNGDVRARILDILISFALLSCNRLIFVSQYTLKSWNKFPWIKQCDHSVIYNAVQIPNNTQIKKIKIKTISFIGRLSKEKQPEIYCELAKHAKAQKLPYKFCLYGDGPLKEKLTVEYAEYVDFMGVENDQNRLYSNTDLVVMTSKFENCPMVILESKIRGIPSISPAVGGIPEIVKNNQDGILLNELNLNSLIDAITIIDNNYISYSEKCIENSASMTIKSVSKKWSEILI